MSITAHRLAQLFIWNLQKYAEREFVHDAVSKGRDLHNVRIDGEFDLVAICDAVIDDLLCEPSAERVKP